jgi:hypothetical protein
VEAIAFVHRCPDQGLVWCRPASGLVLRNAAPGLAAIHRRASLLDSSRSTAPWRSDGGRVKCGWLRLMGAHYAQALHCYRPHQVIGLGLNDDLQRNC